jgi:hypothetical protein
MDYFKKYIDSISENTKQIFESFSKIQEGSILMFEQLLSALSRVNFTKSFQGDKQSKGKD